MLRSIAPQVHRECHKEVACSSIKSKMVCSYSEDIFLITIPQKGQFVNPLGIDGTPRN